MSDIGRVIREIRVNRGFSIGELSRRCGVTKTAISLLESGKTESPAAATVGKIADALDVSADYILNEGGLMSRTPQDWPYLQPEIQWLATILNAYPPSHQPMARRHVAGFGAMLKDLLTTLIQTNAVRHGELVEERELGQGKEEAD